MSAKNGDGVVRIGRKGTKKFAFGEDGAPFEVDVVCAMHGWIAVDEQFRTEEETGSDGTVYKVIPTADMNEYHAAAVGYVCSLATKESVGSGKPEITTAEALDFIARLREEYDALADFFRAKRRKEEDSPDTSAAELRFSEEPANSQPSTN